MRWTDQESGQVRTRAGLQTYRTEAGLLAETWVILQPPGSAWGDAVAQSRWTTRVPSRSRRSRDDRALDEATVGKTDPPTCKPLCG